MSPGGLCGLQIRWGALMMSSVGSTPIRSRQKCLVIPSNLEDKDYPFSSDLLAEWASFLPA